MIALDAASLGRTAIERRLAAQGLEVATKEAAEVAVRRGGETAATRGGRAAHRELAERVVAEGWQSEPRLVGASGRIQQPDVVTRGGPDYGAEAEYAFWPCSRGKADPPIRA